MTIASTDSKISYAGNGSTTVFSIPFYFIANADIVAVLVDAGGVEDTLALTTDYTLSGAGNPSGGTLTMLTAPATGETLVIKRSPDQVQETVYVENDPFPAKAHEMGLDRLTMMVQDLQEQVDRSVKVGLGATTDPDALLAELAADVASAAASAATATTQAGLAATAKAGAETAQAAAEAAVGTVKVSADDTTPAVLSAKLVAGAGVSVTVGNDGGNETLTIAATVTVPAKLTVAANLVLQSVCGGA